MMVYFHLNKCRDFTAKGMHLKAFLCFVVAANDSYSTSFKKSPIAFENVLGKKNDFGCASNCLLQWKVCVKPVD